MEVRFAREFLDTLEGLFPGFLSYYGLQRWEAANQRELQEGVLNQTFYRFDDRLFGGQTRIQHITRNFRTSCNGLAQDGSK